MFIIILNISKMKHLLLNALHFVYRITCTEHASNEAAHFFLGKVTALGVLCCFALFVCLTLLASFFLPSFSSLI